MALARVVEEFSWLKMISSNTVLRTYWLLGFYKNYLFSIPIINHLLNVILKKYEMFFIFD